MYRWKRSCLAIPLKLQLVDTSTSQTVAVMERSWAACIPWAASLGNLTLLNEESQTDATWLLMVVASALKESDRLKHRAIIAGGD